MFNYNQETIYSLLCAVLPCFIYLLVWGRKKPLLHSVWVMIFVLYCWQVYDITGAGGLSDILYRPEGSINPSFIQGTVNLICEALISTPTLKSGNRPYSMNIK